MCAVWKKAKKTLDFWMVCRGVRKAVAVEFRR